jgi:Domain of unknown function (DUF4291)
MASRLVLESYRDQAARWPAAGQHVLAQFDDETVVVYQAYRPEIGHYAAAHGRFGDGFSLARMSWIKPNFLWMMYRSGWGTKPGQEVVLAIWLRRAAFDAIVAQAVPSSQSTRRWPVRADWEAAVAGSDVRLQWDPDHGPGGEPLQRRAVQLGLRGPVLAAYAHEWIVAIEDVSALCAEQRARRADRAALRTPREDVYPVTSAGAIALGMA